MQKGIEKVLVKMRASNCYIYAKTAEIVRSTDNLVKRIDGYGGTNGYKPFNPVVWDFERAIDEDGAPISEYDGDADACITKLLDASPKGTTVIAKNFNWFLNSGGGGFNAKFATILINRYDRYCTRDERKVFIIVSDEQFSKAIPKPLQKLFCEVELGVPEYEEIEEIYGYVAESAKASDKYQEVDEVTRQNIFRSAKGMTKQAIQNALTESLILDQGKMSPITVAKIRAANAPKGVRIMDPTNSIKFKDLIGMQMLKDQFMHTYSNEMALGMLILGPAGTGKTSFAYAAGNESGLPVFIIEAAQLVGEGLYGQAENEWREALDFVKANAPCIVVIDEIEKGVGGGGGAGSSQVNVTNERSTSQLLKFLSDERPPGVYVIATCNNIEQLPAAWVRAERWDTAPWLLNLPSDELRGEILEHYKAVYGVEGVPSDMDGWAPAEIKSVCRNAKMRDCNIEDVEHLIIATAKTMAKEISYLREWAVGKTIDVEGVVKKKVRKMKGKVRNLKPKDLAIEY